MSKQQGFSLVELTVVLAVMGILAVMAASSFASYSAKTQVGEGFKVTEGLKGQFLTYYTESGKVPPVTLADIYGAGDGSAPVHHVGAYVASVNMDSADIVITYGIKAAPVLTGKTLVLTAYESISGNILWHCGLAPAPDDGSTLLGRAGSRTGTATTGTLTLTTVPPEYLPRDCRA